jgi:predicted DCC family thiol-disulfide oxidoreductase YuxK
VDPKAKAKPKPKPRPAPQAQPKPPDAETGEENDHEVPEAADSTYSYKKDSAVPKFPDDKPLFVFDGVCVLCSRTVAWLMRGPKGGEFYYASAQSPLGQALYRHYGLEMNDTYLLIDKGVPYTKSDGYIHMFAILGPPWHFLYALKEIPVGLRDKVYDLVARNRYKWFGKAKTECELIPEEFRKNMLQ